MDFNASYWESLTLEYDWVWVQPLRTRNHWELRVSDASWDTAAVIANVDRPGDRIFVKEIWLVVEPYPSEKYDFVSWDDDIPIYYGKNPTFQTTNQYLLLIAVKYNLNLHESLILTVIGCFFQGSQPPLPNGAPQQSSHTDWLVVKTPLKNMNVSWDDHSQY